MNTPPPTLGNALGSVFSGFEDASRPALPAQRYVTVSELGRGGMGVVYRVEDTFLGRQVALKRARQGLPESVQQRLLREAAITARLPHPSIPPMYDTGFDEDGAYYTMPILTGVSLSRWLDESGHREARQRRGVEIVQVVAEAVQSAHEIGIIHRDLKPDNIRIGEHGEVWVLDWGVALDPLAPVHGALGTEGYCSPEQAAGDVVGPASDVYSVGRLLWDVLSATGADAALESIATRATAHAPANRYSSLSELADELRAWSSHQPVGAHQYSLLELSTLWISRHRGAVIAMAAAVGVVATGIVAAVVQQRADVFETRQALIASLVARAQSSYARGRLEDAIDVLTHSDMPEDHPARRGLLLDWESRTHTQPVEVIEAPCDTTLRPEGVFECKDEESIDLYDHRGRRLGSWPHAGKIVAFPPPSSGRWLGAYNDIHLRDLSTWERLDEDVVAAVFMIGPDVWSKGSDLYKGFPGVRIGAGCPDKTDFGSVSSNQAGDRYALTCSGGELRMLDGTMHRVLPGAQNGISSATISGNDVWFSRWDGSLGRLTWAPDSEPLLFSPGMGPIRQVAAFDEYIAIRSEDGDGLVYDTHGALLLRLPVPIGDIAVIEGALWTRTGSQIHRWTMPEERMPSSFDFTAFGGIADIDISLDSNALLIGHGTSMVSVLDLETGDTHHMKGREGHVNKGLYWTSDGRARVPREPADGRAYDEVSLHGEHLPIEHPPARECAAIPGVTLCRTYSDNLYPMFDTDGPAVWDLAKDHERILILREDGRVEQHTGSGRETLFTAPHSHWVDVQDEHIALAGRDWVALHGRNGNRVWHTPIEGVTPASVAVTTKGRVAVGGEDGALLVFREGQLEAALPSAHARRISEFATRGEVLYSAGWDGRIRKWDLATLE